MLRFEFLKLVCKTDHNVTSTTSSQLRSLCCLLLDSKELSSFM